MKLITVDTGSRGNCYLVEYDGKLLALESGVSWRNVQLACGFQTSRLVACILSHEHGDHCKYYKDFVKNGITVYAEDQVAKRIMEVNGEHIRGIRVKHQTRIVGGCILVPFEIPHENIPNFAYLIDFPNGERLLYATDFEYIGFNLSRWKINHFLVAVSRTEDIPDDVEARDHRIRGHSSLETVKDFLRVSMSDRCKTVTACHLSGSFADENKILNELQEICGDSIKVSIAHKGETIDL